MRWLAPRGRHRRPRWYTWDGTASWREPARAADWTPWADESLELAQATFEAAAETWPPADLGHTDEYPIWRQQP